MAHGPHFTRHDVSMTDEQARVDPRTRRTLEALTAAMAELLPTTPLRQISVARLCRTAGIHRTTFYKHYDTVGEVAAVVVEDLTEGLAPASGGGFDTFAEWLDALLGYVGARRVVLTGLLGPDGDPALVRTLCDHLVERAESYLLAAVARRGGEDIGTDTRTAARVVGFASYGAVEATLADGREVRADSYLATLPMPWPDLLAPLPAAG